MAPSRAPANNKGRRSGDRAGREYPSNHYLPRTRRGRLALVLFLLLLALTQPPIVHGWANRIEPWVAGLPFLYAYLLVVYVALIAVLVWVYRRGL